MENIKKIQSNKICIYNLARKTLVTLKKTAVICFYKFFSTIMKKNRIVIYSATKNDVFGNASAIANLFKIKNISYTHITLPDLNYRSFYTFYCIARARVLLVDAVSPASVVHLHKKTCLIQCWHAGGAYKKMGFDAKRRQYSQEKEDMRIARIHRCINYFICTSKFVASIYKNAFHLKTDQILVFGLPRIDCIINRTIHNIHPEENVILYAPTYRTDKYGKRYMYPVFDGEKLLHRLRSCFGINMRLALRMHPSVKIEHNFTDWEDWSSLSQQDALSRASILVTDYSSIFFDFLVFSRPIIFYVPDINKYQIEERGLYFSPYDVFPETTCDEEKKLFECIGKNYNKKIDYSSIWNRYMSACDGKSTERVCDFVMKIMKS